MKIFVDIDGTICDTPFINNKWDYKKSVPNKAHIDKINKLYNEGHEITYWTARGAVTGINWYQVTKNQLDKWGCKYHQLFLGKPAGDFYIDDRGISDNDFFK